MEKQEPCFYKKKKKKKKINLRRKREVRYASLKKSDDVWFTVIHWRRCSAINSSIIPNDSITEEFREAGWTVTVAK